MSRKEKSAQMKEVLLKMAEAGDKRPSTKTPEGRALNNYTTVGGNSWDAGFSATIKEARKDWFRNTENKPKIHE